MQSIFVFKVDENFCKNVCFGKTDTKFQNKNADLRFS